jgi:hypothetical protein
MNWLNQYRNSKRFFLLCLSTCTVHMISRREPVSSQRPGMVRRRCRMPLRVGTRPSSSCCNHIKVDRQVNHINRKVKSDCLACKGLRQGQSRAKHLKRDPLGEVSGNKRRHHGRGGQTVYGCRLCDVAICNNQNCWDFYHHIL